MFYRIDYQHFLMFAIDYFTRNELSHMQYVIISSIVTCSNTANNCVKVNNLYPDADAVADYAINGDKDIFRRKYFDQLCPKSIKDKHGKEQSSNPYTVTIYKCIINPMINLHYNVCLVCDKTENFYIDILCDYIAKTFHIEVIDLNQLFDKGKVGKIHINRGDIRDAAVDIRRAAALDEWRNMATTVDGKARLIAEMDKKTKIRQLKKYGVRVTNKDLDHLDRLLLEEWCAEDGDEKDLELYDEMMESNKEES